MRTLWIFGTIATLTVGLGLQLERTQSQTQSQQSEIERLRAELSVLTESLRAEKAGHEHNLINAAERAYPAMQSESNGQAVQDLKPAAPEHLTDLKSDRQPLATSPEDMQDKLDTVFEEEIADPSWASDAEYTAEQKLAVAMPESSAISSIECRSSICRIETFHQNSDAYGKFSEQAFKNPDTRIWTADAFSALVSGDEQVGLIVVSYVSREGKALPSMDTKAESSSN